MEMKMNTNTNTAAFDVKDSTRIADIIRKSKGSNAKALQLAGNMAKAITSAEKAMRRARAAEDVNQHDIAEIFFNRYNAIRYPLANRTTAGMSSRPAPVVVRKPQLRTISVREMLEVLENEDPDALLIFTSDYGDHSHTDQALPIEGTVEEVLIEKSAYSNSGFALATDDDDEDNTDKYLVIR
jgi:hypothetical protein